MRFEAEAVDMRKEIISLPNNNQIIVVRHGDTRYTNAPPDLTEVGVAQITQTAQALEPHLRQFENIRLVSSPAVRAIGSARIFATTLGYDENNISIVNPIRPLEIKKLDDFLEYNKLNHSDKYGEMWFKDELLATSNHLTEGRDEVESRSARFLYHYMPFLEKERCRTVVVALTHYEIGSIYMTPLLSDAAHPVEFPIDEHDAMRNGEFVVCSVTDGSGIYNFSSRGKTKEVFYDMKHGKFLPTTIEQ